MTSADQRDLDTKIQVIEGLVRRDPNYVDAPSSFWATITRNAPASPRACRWTNASRASNRRTRLFFTISACSYSLTGQFDRAVAALKKALPTAISRGSPRIPT